MNWPDIINGCFEMGGAVLLTKNVRALYRDKVLRGVHWTPTAFFAGWGMWNLYFYPALNQWFSFAGGCAIVVVNTIWLTQMFYYRAMRDAALGGKG